MKLRSNFIYLVYGIRQGIFIQEIVEMNFFFNSNFKHLLNSIPNHEVFLELFIVSFECVFELL